jgi:hypothetical protein
MVDFGSRSKLSTKSMVLGISRKLGHGVYGTCKIGNEDNIPEEDDAMNEQET